MNANKITKVITVLSLVFFAASNSMWAAQSNTAPQQTKMIARSPLIKPVNNSPAPVIKKVTPSNDTTSFLSNKDKGKGTLSVPEKMYAKGTPKKIMDRYPDVVKLPVPKKENTPSKITQLCDGLGKCQKTNPESKPQTPTITKPDNPEITEKTPDGSIPTKTLDIISFSGMLAPVDMTLKARVVEKLGVKLEDLQDVKFTAEGQMAGTMTFSLNGIRYIAKGAYVQRPKLEGGLQLSDNYDFQYTAEPFPTLSSGELCYDPTGKMTECNDTPVIG